MPLNCSVKLIKLSVKSLRQGTCFGLLCQELEFRSPVGRGRGAEGQNVELLSSFTCLEGIKPPWPGPQPCSISPSRLGSFSGEGRNVDWN